MTTGTNPMWSIFSNAPRDLMTLFTYSKEKNPVKLLNGIGNAYINAFNNKVGKDDKVDPLYKEYLAMGGGRTSAYSADVNLAKKARNELTKKSLSIKDKSDKLGIVYYRYYRAGPQICDLQAYASKRNEALRSVL